MMIHRWAILAALAVASNITAQAPPTFDAASVKPVKPDDGAGSRSSSNEFMGSLQALIRFAWRIDDYRIAGGPKWLDNDKFSVVYKPSGPQANLMLRTLLADRFKLAMHTESRPLPIYKLIVAKNGPKMEQAGADGGTSAGGSRINGTMNTSLLVSYLSSIVGRGVIDETGLKGFYKVDLRWTPDDQPASTANNAPSLVTAIQEQLGLQLESAKGPVEVYVIDRAEKPSEN